MITKKLFVISCLFLVLPVCAMRRGARVSAMGAGLLRRSAFSRRFSSLAFQATSLNNKQRRKRRNTKFELAGMPTDFVPKRLFCTKEQQKNEQDVQKYKMLKKRAKWSAGGGVVAGIISGYNFFNFIKIVINIEDETKRISLPEFIKQSVGGCPSSLDSMIKMAEIYENIYSYSGWASVSLLAVSLQYGVRVFLLNRQLKKSEQSI